MDTVKLQNIEEFSYAMRESLRALKTNIQFCGDDIKVIMITSSTPDEGKTVVSFDLARSLTESGKRVLLIDTDLRKSVLVGRLRAKIENNGEISGLSHLLSGQAQVDDVLYSTNINKLYMIFAGPSVPNPTEILEKKYFEKLIELARENFDYVILDCPPLGAAIDAAVIGRHTDGAIVVVAQGITSRRMISGVKKQLETAGIRILGAVVNKVKTEGAGIGSYYSKYYGGYYGSYYGKYYGRSDDESDSEKDDSYKQ